MNRQVNYIIYAMLLSLSLPIGYYFIDKIVSTVEVSKNQDLNLNKEKKFVAPAMSKSAIAGKSLFMSKCASCHRIFESSTGPGLAYLEDRGPWIERQNVYEWIKNPPAFMKKNKYVQGLQSQFRITMQSFPDITNEEVDA